MEDFEEEVIFDDDEFLDDVESSEEPQNDDNHSEEQINEEPDLTTDVLKLRGIDDPSKIKFEDETGAVIERSWDSLTRNEQLNILTDNGSIEDELYEDEIELLNQIRESGMSVNDYLNSRYSNQEVEQRFEIDSLSDEEVYALDILDKVGADNITDEELEQAVEQAKNNQDLFNKTVQGLRNEYKRLENEEISRTQQEQHAQQQQQFNNFSNVILSEINNLNSFGGQELELSHEDAENLAAFMLDLDDNGVSAFGHALNDPALFTKAAFWLLNEEEIMSEINKQIQMNYQRGYEAGKKDSSRSSLVMNTQKKQTQVDNEEAFFDDEEW